MSVSACIFVPLYRFFPVFEAFMIQFIVVAATAYMGMYLCVKELTGSSFVGFLCGGMFLFLPWQPVYGLSLVGLPLVFYAFLRLYRGQEKGGRWAKSGWRETLGPMLLILYYALGANLVLTGYVALGFVFLADILILVRWTRKDRYLPEGTERQGIRRRNKRFLLGSLELLVVYSIINFSLFSELLLGNGEYVSHREEMVIAGNSDFWGCVKNVFLHSAQHAPSLHEKLILPIVALIVFYGFRWRSWRREAGMAAFGKDLSEKAEHGRQCRRMYGWLVLIMAVNVLAALFYGFCQSSLVVDFRNSVSGFFHYFSPQRVYWIFPTTWYAAAGLAAGLIWKDHGFLTRRKIPGYLAAGVIICAMLVPAAWNIRQNSIWLLNKSQYKNNCSVGLMSWAEYFAEDLMEEIDTAICEKTGMTKDQYRVASLGMCPAPALEAGFYCIDGYSNNYSLEYKHEFREIIEKELEKVRGWDRILIPGAAGAICLRRKAPIIITDQNMTSFDMKIWN